MSPTGLTLDLLRSSGYVAGVVETWIPKVDRRRDLFGIADVIGCRPAAKDILLVQCTSLSNLSARVKKARSKGELLAWLRSGGRFECWGWHREGAGRWQVKRVELTGDDLAAEVLMPRKRRGRLPVQKGLFDSQEQHA